MHDAQNFASYTVHPDDHDFIQLLGTIAAALLDDTWTSSEVAQATQAEALRVGALRPELRQIHRSTLSRPAYSSP